MIMLRSKEYNFGNVENAVIFGKIQFLNRNINIEALYFLHYVRNGDARKHYLTTDKLRNGYVLCQYIFCNYHHANGLFNLRFEERGENINRLDKWFWSISNDFWIWVAKKGGLQ